LDRWIGNLSRFFLCKKFSNDIPLVLVLFFLKQLSIAPYILVVNEAFHDAARHRWVEAFISAAAGKKLNLQILNSGRA
jgi:hypothetical protein